MTYKFFHKLTGVLLPGDMLLPNQAAVVAHTPEDHEAIWAPGVDHRTHRIDPATLAVVPRETPPVYSEEYLADMARQRRDQLPNDTRWVIERAQEQALLTGSAIAVPLSWLEYRQWLRDLPLQPDFPFSITWPEMPT